MQIDYNILYPNMHSKDSLGNTSFMQLDQAQLVISFMYGSSAMFSPEEVVHGSQNVISHMTK